MYYLICLLLFLSTSCASNTGTGIITGTILGAGAGGLTAGGSGAIIGTAAGFLAGGLVGAALDSQDKKVMEQSSPRTVDRMERGEPLTINDIIKLSQSGVSDDAISSYLKKAEGCYMLSQAQIRRLQEAGVSQRIINEMLAAGK